MTAQTELFRKPALSNSTPTSDAAARAIEPKRPRLWWTIFRALQNNPAGLTAEELEGVTGMAGNTIRPRLVELCETQLVTKTERTRKTRRGHDAVVYVAVPQYNER